MIRRRVAPKYWLLFECNTSLFNSYRLIFLLAQSCKTKVLNDFWPSQVTILFSFFFLLIFLLITWQEWREWLEYEKQDANGYFLSWNTAIEDAHLQSCWLASVSGNWQVKMLKMRIPGSDRLWICYPSGRQDHRWMWQQSEIQWRPILC